MTFEWNFEFVDDAEGSYWMISEKGFEKFKDDMLTKSEVKDEINYHIRFHKAHTDFPNQRVIRVLKEIKTILMEKKHVY